MNVIEEHGYRPLTMRRLADRLDVGVMSLYWYFRTKEQLVGGDRRPHARGGRAPAYIGPVAGADHHLATGTRWIGRLTNPWFAVSFFAVMQWTWAVPVLLEATSSSSALHLLQHALLLYAGILLWWAVIDPLGHRSGRPGMHRIVIVGLSRLATVAVCLPLTFLDKEMFPAYAAKAVDRGLDPIVQQQLAGGSMCLLEILIFGIAFGAVLIDALRREERQQARADRATLRGSR